MSTRSPALQLLPHRRPMFDVVAFAVAFVTATATATAAVTMEVRCTVVVAAAAAVVYNDGGTLLPKLPLP